MGRDLSVTIIPCGAMTADITWLLLAPGRAMRTRQNKTAPAEWTDVPSHCVLVDTPDGRLPWCSRTCTSTTRATRSCSGTPAPG